MPDSRLNSDLEHLTGDEFFHFFDKGFATRVRKIAVDDPGQRVNRFAAHKDVEFDQIRCAIAGEVIVKRCISAGD